MKRLSPVFALTALAAATVATAQQTPPSAEPPPDTNQSQSMLPSETAAPTDRSSGVSKADKKELMENCITRVQADNPIADARDIKGVCKKRLDSNSSRQSPRN